MSRVRLGDVCKVINGRAYKQEELLKEGVYPVLRVGNFFSNNSWYYSDLELGEDKYCDNDDLLFAWSASFGPRIWKGGKVIYHYHIWKLECNEKKINRVYLYYFLLHRTHSMIGSTHGSIMLHITKSFMEDLPIELPDLSTQQKIAAVLSALDDKIEVNNKINAELEAMAKTLYDYWFVQFEFPITNESHPELVSGSHPKGYKSAGGKMVKDSNLNMFIPENWKVGRIGDYCESIGGFAFKSSWWTDRGNAVIKIKDIQEDNTINLSDLSYVDVSDKNIAERFIAKPGNVLIAMTGATIGKFAIVPYTSDNMYVNQRVGYFNLGKNPTEKLPFLINSLSQKYFRETIFSLAVGAAQPNISNEQINDIHLLLPTDDLIEKFNIKFEPLYKKILNNLKQNQELAQLRDWLLPMLMNGQVKVEDTADEVLGMVAESTADYKTNENTKENRFALWLSNQKLAARGDIDEVVLREIFDAMDDEDQ